MSSLVMSFRADSHGVNLPCPYITCKLQIALSPQDSIGIDLALLAQCDHVITSEGTFGQWGALLASNESIHIKGLVYNQEKELAKVVEVEALKKANMSNFLFMDDL